MSGVGGNHADILNPTSDIEILRGPKIGTILNDTSKNAVTTFFTKHLILNN